MQSATRSHRIFRLLHRLSKLVVFLPVSVSAMKELRRINTRGERNIERQDEETVR